MVSAYRKKVYGQMELYLYPEAVQDKVIDELIDYVATHGATIELEGVEEPEYGYLLFEFTLSTSGTQRSEEASWGYDGGTPGYTEEFDRISLDTVKKFLQKYASDVLISRIRESYDADTCVA